MGIGGGTLDTTLRFGDGREAELELDSVAISVGRVRPAGWSPRVTAGWISGGTIRQEGGTVHDFSGGFLIAAGLDKRLSPGGGVRPAVDLSLGLSAAWAQTEQHGTGTEADYSAADLRLGVRTMWPVGTRFFPYAAARVFGGPVNWNWNGDDVQGSDAHHYQLAVGAAAALGRIALQVEWGALGEQSLSAGISTLW